MWGRLSGDQIRILELLPYGSNDDTSPICCDISVAALSDEPQYEALSYCWGQSDKTIDIEVAGGRLPITTNLQAALHHLRLPDRKRSLWIDQLCVNQDDNEERLSQVHLMCDVYSRCSRCLIWLGEIEHEFSLADAQAAVDLVLFLSDGDETTQVPTSITSADAPAFKRYLRALASASCYHNQWWQRIWTVQEAILPPEAQFHWGPLQVPWARVVTALSFPTHKWWTIQPLLDRHEIRDTSLIINYIDIQYAIMIWIQNSHYRRDTALDTATKWRARKATVPHDKVFGLRGLLEATVELPNTNKCSYETSAATLYSAFTVDLILDGMSLEPLVVEPRIEQGKKTKDIPNWAIDLSDGVEYGVDVFYRRWGHGQVYKACGEAQPDQQLLLKAAAVQDYDFKVLGLCGIRVDKVKALAPSRLIKSYSTVIPDMTVAQILRGWLDFARSHDRTGGFSEEAFYRLVLGDAMRDFQLEFKRRPTADDLRQAADLVREGTRDQGWLYDASMLAQICNQVFFVTQSGMMGLGHLDTDPEDEVWVFDGGRFPFTIRRQERENEEDFDFVGCCYVQGIMFGEAYMSENHESSKRTVRIY